MIISDLNYLEDATQEIVGGVGVTINSNFTLNKTVTANVSETFTKTISTNLGGLQGNVAEVVGSSDATGNNTFTSIIFGTQTDPGRSESLVNAISASR